jgi:hypothetical protein
MSPFGRAGAGKTMLIKNMIISDIKAGSGLAIIDPHGDLVDHLLHFIPDKRIDEVIYPSSSDLNYQIAFNPFQKVDHHHHHLVALGLILVFKKIWYESWGPRMEHILRNAILSLLDYTASTLLDIPFILVDR